MCMFNIWHLATRRKLYTQTFLRRKKSYTKISWSTVYGVSHKACGNSSTISPFVTACDSVQMVRCSDGDEFKESHSKLLQWCWAVLSLVYHWHGYKKYATQCLVFKSLSHLSAIIQSVNSKPRMFQQWVEVAHCLGRSILSCITSLQAWLSAVVVDASVPNQPQTQDSLVDFQKGFWQQGRYTQKRRHAWVWSKVVSAERYSGSQYYTHGKKLSWMQTFSKTQTPKFNFPQTFPTIQ